MKIMKHKIKLALPAIAYFTFYLCWFYIIERAPERDYTIIHMKMDDRIPFCEYFIIPYFLWFGYVAWILFYLFFTNEKDFLKCCTFFFSGMTIFLVVSTLFPNIHYLRPSVMPRDTIFTKMVVFLYSIDTSTNLWPSIHVYNSMGVLFAVNHNGRLSSKPFIRLSCFILTILIILSTVFLKQHSVYDVMTGILMGVAIYIITYRTAFLSNLHHRLLAFLKKKAHTIG